MEDIIYKHALKHIVSKMGNKITDGKQLLKAGRELFGKKIHGVYPADRIPKLTKQQPYCIANLDTANMFGSHWVAIVRDGNDLLFYDSFGRKASKILPYIYEGGRNVINTEDDKEQDLNGVEENCGQRSLTALFIYDQFGRKMFLKL